MLAPYIDALWTPPYWGYDSGRYRWHAGYWSRHIGYYGGINYGFGYTGLGYYGGYWNRGAFVYNRAVNHVNTSVVRNVYSHSVTNYTPFTRVSYNGGPGGIDRHPTAAELAVTRESRVAPVPAQMAHVSQAAADRSQFAAENHGRAATAALARPPATPYRAPAAPPANWQRNEGSRGAPPQRVEPEAPRAMPNAAARGFAEPRPAAPATREMPLRMPPERMAQQAAPPRPAEPLRNAPIQREARSATRQQPVPQRAQPVQQPHFEPHPAEPARQEARPTPQPQHATPQPFAHPAPPAPQHFVHPAAPARQEARPAPPPQHAAPQPAAHPAPPDARPAAPPQARPAPARDDRGRGGQ